MSGTYPVYETMLIRGLTSLPILAVWLAHVHGLKALGTPLWPRMLLRALILCSAYLAFILAIAAMPIANMVAIYFTMPFFVAGLAGPFLGERVPLYRWIAIIAGFIGVLVMVRPGMQAFEPASLLAALFGIWLCRRTDDGTQPGAAGGAAGHRQLAERGLFRCCRPCRALLRKRPAFPGRTTRALPFSPARSCGRRLQDFLLLSAVGVLAAFAMMSFISAYGLAQSSFRGTIRIFGHGLGRAVRLPVLQ